MNQLVELPKTDGGLVTINPQTYVTTAYESFITRFELAVKQFGEVKYEITTKAGMETAKAARAAFRDIRTGAEKKRVECKEPIISIGKLLDSRNKEIEAMVTPLESRFDADIKAEEKRLDDEKAAKIKAEAERQYTLQKKIDDIKNAPLAALNMTAEGMAGVLDILELTDPVEEIFAERFVEAEVALKASIAQLNSMIDGKRASEELARQQEALRIENEAKAKAEAEAKAAEEVKQRAAQEAEALRLKAENEAIEKARAEFQREKAAFEAEKAARAEEESKARAKAEAEAQAIIAKAAAEQQAALAAERAQIEIEARAKAQAEAVAQRKERIMSKMDWMDAEELAAKVCGLPDDYDSDGVETAIYEKFDCSFETFHKIAESLMKFTLPAKSALTDKVYRGFVDGDFFICKGEVE